VYEKKKRKRKKKRRINWPLRLLVLLLVLFAVGWTSYLSFFEPVRNNLSDEIYARRVDQINQEHKDAIEKLRKENESDLSDLQEELYRLELVYNKDLKPAIKNQESRQPPDVKSTVDSI
jgi:flagellar biosynthesis/type III secretory pathway M-ring protein FliF/YscJ